jgi:hypothetical protein
MRCRVVRNHLLASASPAQSPGAVAEHLEQCAACRDWRRELLRIERLVPHLTVPPSNGLDACLQEVLHGAAYQRPGTPEVEWQRRERVMRKVAVTFAMAAGLLFFALVWYAWQHQANDGIQPPLVAQRSEIERIVGHFDPGALEAKTPHERIKRLASVADRLSDQARDRAQKGLMSELPLLAHQYAVVVREGLLAQARAVPQDERDQVLSSIADQLAHTESDARQLAVQYRAGTKPFDDIAIAARTGHNELRELIAGNL